MTGASFDYLDPTQFEEFCADLLQELGFVNIDWRKGTAKKGSPADSGRDIVCQLIKEDVDGSRHIETWFVDCKHYQRGIPPTELDNLLAWSQAEGPDVALIATSGFLSNPAKDYVKSYRSTRKPPFRIKYWEQPQLERWIIDKEKLSERYGFLTGRIRSEKEIQEAEGEFFDKVWLDRHELLKIREKEGQTKTDPQVLKDAMKAASEVRKRYKKSELGPYSDFDWGMINGKLSALRWVLGDEWDILDT